MRRRASGGSSPATSGSTHMWGTALWSAHCGLPGVSAGGGGVENDRRGAGAQELECGWYLASWGEHSGSTSLVVGLHVARGSLVRAAMHA